MQKIDVILADVIKNYNIKEPAALLFSGGTDSLTIFWTLQKLSIPFTCYTFHLKRHISTDAKVASLCCKYWNVRHIIIQENQDVKKDVEETIKIIKSSRKTHVEVMYAYLHLFRGIKENVVFSGLQADTLYGSNKQAAIKHGKSDAGRFTAYRKKLLEDKGQEGLHQACLLAQSFNKKFYAPYTNSEVRDWFFKFSWKDLNTPKQKYPTVKAFSDKFKEINVYRKDDNLQCGSKIRELMADTFQNHQRKAYKTIYAKYYNL